MNDLGGNSYAPATVPTDQEKYFALAAHLGVILGIWLAGLTFLVPLIIYLIKKGQSEYVEKNALQALVFNIGCFVLYLIAMVLGFITCGVGFILIPLIAIGNILYAIIGALRSWEGMIYEYPLTSKFVKR